MAKMFQVYGIGQATIPVLPPPIPFENAPTSSQTNYEVGQLVFTPGPNATAFYIYAGAGTWVKLTDSDGPVESVTGTANQILANPTSGDVVLSLIGPYTPATYTAHGVLIGEGSSSIVATAVGTDGQVLTGNSAADPAFAAIGTKSGLTAHGVVIAEGAGAFAATAAGTAGQVLTSGGAAADPVWTTATFPATAGATGTILRSDGTNWIASTSTYPDVVAVNSILYASSADVVGQISPVSSAVLSSDGSGIPSMVTGASFVPAFSLATPGDSAWTYSSQVGRYIQIGPIVYFNAQLTWSNFTNSTGSGNWQLNIPVTSGAFASCGQVAISGSGIDASAETANLPANFLGVIGNAQSVVELLVEEGGIGNAASALFNLTVTQVKTAGTLNISGWYFTA